MARPIWNGTISFGLLNVPVQLYSGERTVDLHFRMLDSRDNSPVRYERVNSETGEEVPWKEIVKGFEYSKGNYVVIDAADIRKAAPESTETVEILMRFPQEIVKPDELTLPKGSSKSYRVTAPEVAMATQLIEAMTKKWNPDDYRDEFRAQLRKIIDEQVARQSGKKARAHQTEAAAPAQATTNVVDFMELLKRSLEKGGKRGGRAAPRKTARKAPARERRSRRSTGRKAAS